MLQRFDCTNTMDSLSCLACKRMLSLHWQEPMTLVPLDLPGGATAEFGRPRQPGERVAVLTRNDGRVLGLLVHHVEQGVAAVHVRRRPVALLAEGRQHQRLAQLLRHVQVRP